MNRGRNEPAFFFWTVTPRTWNFYQCEGRCKNLNLHILERQKRKANPHSFLRTDITSRFTTGTFSLITFKCPFLFLARFVYHFPDIFAKHKFFLLPSFTQLSVTLSIALTGLYGAAGSLVLVPFIMAVTIHPYDRNPFNREKCFKRQRVVHRD